MEEPINCRLIIEAQGTPKEHVARGLKQLVEKLKLMKGVEVYDTKEQSPVETPQKLFSGLVDVGVKVDSFEKLSFIVLNFGPSAVIVLGPEQIQVTARELQNAVNDMANLLHQFAQANIALRVNNFIIKQGQQPAGESPKK